MKNLIKKYSKIVLFAGLLLFSCEAFSAREATKRMIHDTLSKYCIPAEKRFCNPSQEGQYDPNYNFCLCNDDGMVYSKSQRKCVECRAGTYYRKNMKDNKCKSCSPGTYSGSGASSCTDCPAGSYQDESGKSSCKECPDGKFQPYSGKSKCRTCNASACYEVRNDKTSCEYYCTTPNLTACSRGTCVECTSDSHCSGYCVGYSCVECRYDSHCGSDEVCEGNICIAKPNCSGCYGTYQRSSNSCGYSCSGGQVCVSNSCKKKKECGECYTYNSTTNECDGGPDKCDPKTQVQDGCGCKDKPAPNPPSNKKYCCTSWNDSTGACLTYDYIDLPEGFSCPSGGF